MIKTEIKEHLATVEIELLHNDRLKKSISIAITVEDAQKVSDIIRDGYFAGLDDGRTPPCHWCNRSCDSYNMRITRDYRPICMECVKSIAELKEQSP